MMSADTLVRVRNILMALAGLVTATYSICAWALDTPRPFPWWLPAAAGISAAVAIWVSAFAAGRRNADMAMDELFQLEWGKALQISYWLGIAFFIIGAIAISRDWVGSATAVASLGTAYGAAPMLIFTYFNLRG